jgi:hypothetical protein
VRKGWEFESPLAPQKFLIFQNFFQKKLFFERNFYPQVINSLRLHNALRLRAQPLL